MYKLIIVQNGQVKHWTTSYHHKSGPRFCTHALCVRRVSSFRQVLCPRSYIRHGPVLASRYLSFGASRFPATPARPTRTRQVCNDCSSTIKCWLPTTDLVSKVAKRTFRKTLKKCFPIFHHFWRSCTEPALIVLKTFYALIVLFSTDSNFLPKARKKS